MRISYSKLSTYFRCGLQYRLRYAEKIPSRPKAHFRFGSVLHSVLGRFYRYEGEGKPSLEVLLSSFRNVWPVEDDRDRRLHALGLQILREYYRANIGTRCRPVWVECAFDVSMGRHSIQGVFDRVDQVGEDGYRVLDYKAGTVVPTQEELDRDLQLSVYGLAFWKMAGTVPEELSVYHLRENIEISTVRAVEQLKDTERLILGAGDRMSRREGLGARESEECKWCDYGAYCPLRTDEPVPVHDQLELTF